MDKIRTKQVWQSLGLPTAKYKIADKRSFDAGSCKAIMSDLGEEVMVKPAQEGSSIGMARVNSALTLESAIQDAFKYDNKVLMIIKPSIKQIVLYIPVQVGCLNKTSRIWLALPWTHLKLSLVLVGAE